MTKVNAAAGVFTTVSIVLAAPGIGSLILVGRDPRQGPVIMYAVLQILVLLVLTFVALVPLVSVLQGKVGRWGGATAYASGLAAGAATTLLAQSDPYVVVGIQLPILSLVLTCLLLTVVIRPLSQGSAQQQENSGVRKPEALADTGP